MTPDDARITRAPSSPGRARRMPSRLIEGPRDRERIPTVVVPDHDDLAVLLADRVVDVIARTTAASGRCVLGLATGSTPLGIYRELIRRHQAGEVDFARVITFNLDEYYPMPPDSPHSYRGYMWENLFAHVNIRPEQVHIPDGSVPRERLAEYCAAFERAIVEAGGIDLQLLGIGKSGHIGFNEPGSSQDSRTGLATLDTVTRKDAAADFFGEDNVPREAITMGVATILGAREIALIATGEHKAEIVARAVEGEVSPDVAATFLQRHGNTTGYLDLAAAAELTRIKTPWVLASVDWTPALTERATVWLAEQTGKALLKLTARDYAEHHLSPLLAKHGAPGARRCGSELRAQGTGRRGPAGGAGPEAHDPRVRGDRGARVGRAAGHGGPFPQSALLSDGRGAEAPDRPRRCRDRARAARGSPPGPRVRRGRPVRSARDPPHVQGGGHAGARGLRRDPPGGVAVPRRVAGVAPHGGERPGAAVPGRAAGEGVRDLQASVAEGYRALPGRARRPRVLAAGRNAQRGNRGARRPAGPAGVLRDGGLPHCHTRGDRAMNPMTMRGLSLAAVVAVWTAI